MTPVNAPVLPLAEPHAKLETLAEAAPAQDAGFGDALEQALSVTNDRLRVAESAGAEFAAGVRDDIHGTMVALASADISLRFMGNVKNKVVDAFYELWRMQI